MRWCARAASASAALTIASSRASIRSSSTRARRVMSSLWRSLKRRRAWLFRPARSVSSIHMSPAGNALPVRGKPNCCVRISALGVHRDGGSAGPPSVPSGNLIPAQGLTLDECATVEFLAIGAHAVRRGAGTSRDKVLVVGAGPIGLGVALFALLSGANVSVFDRDAERGAAAQSIMAITAIPAEHSSPQTAGALDLVGGFDVVFDATGNQAAMERSFDFVAHGGRCVLVGVVKGAISFMDPDFHRKEMTHSSRAAMPPRRISIASSWPSAMALSPWAA